MEEMEEMIKKQIEKVTSERMNLIEKLLIEQITKRLGQFEIKALAGRLTKLIQGDVSNYRLDDKPILIVHNFCSLTGFLVEIIDEKL